MAVTTIGGSQIDERFAEFRRTGDRRLRNELVEDHLGLADYHVKRYSGRGVPADDLRQLAMLSILRAVVRFDPEMRVAFSTFASRTIDGELKRYFRDRTWSIRPPRRAQELHLELRRAEEDLVQRLGRTPSVAELARELDVDVDAVLEAMEAGSAHQAASLDAPAPGTEDSTRGDRVASRSATYSHADREMLVRELLESLPERERTVVFLRYFEDLTQPEIAERIGVSQSYLSRILRRALLSLREQLGDAAVGEMFSD
jgi:RNA polymerase sigma-B factor